MISPTQTKAKFQCFSCDDKYEVPFSKIYNGREIYQVCKGDCLGIALKTLGIVIGDIGNFTTPLDIVVQEHTGFAKVSRSPIVRSLGSPNLNSCDKK